MSGLDRSTFLRPIAHRGLHDKGAGRIENTAPAFQAGIAGGFGIECDIRPAAGGLPVVFHDESTERLIGESRCVAELTAADLLRLRHGDGSPILRLSELIDLVAGRVPLLVEIKSDFGAPDESFLKEVTRLSLAYAGPLVLMSFDPDLMAKMRALAPSVPRGIVAAGTGPDDPLARRIGPERARELSQLLGSGAAGPDFYAYRVSDLPTPVTRYAREVQGVPLFAWTVRTHEDYEIASRWADAPIFEGLLPP